MHPLNSSSSERSGDLDSKSVQFVTDCFLVISNINTFCLFFNRIWLLVAYFINAKSGILPIQIFLREHTCHLLFFGLIQDNKFLNHDRF